MRKFFSARFVKRILRLVLVLCLLFSMWGCGADDSITLKSRENAITSFLVLGQEGDSIIDNVNHTVTFFTDGIDASNLNPTISVSSKATINPPSGSVQNFLKEVKYTVTSEDGTIQEWVVNSCENTSIKYAGHIPNMNEISIPYTNYSIPEKSPDYDIFFVTPDGSVGADGTINKPYTISEAVEAARQGSYLIIREGTYRGIKITLTKKLIIQAYPGEKAWFKGSVVVTDWQKDGNIYKKTGWIYSFPYVGNIAAEELKDSPPMAGYSDMAFIDGVPMKQVAMRNEVLPNSNTFCVDTVDDIVYISEVPDNKLVELTNMANGIVMEAGVATEGIQVKGLGFAQYANQSMVVKGKNVTIEKNTIAWIGYRGILFNNGTDCIIRDNIVVANASTGINGGKMNNAIVEGNVVSYNNVEHYANTWAAAGMKFTNSFDMIVRNNTYIGNFSLALWFDVNCFRAVVYDNMIYNSQSSGVLFELSNACISAFNVFYGNGVGISIGDSTNCMILNNTFIKNKKNIRVNDSNRVYVKNAADPLEVQQNSTWITKNTTIKNNILSDAKEYNIEVANFAFQPSILSITDMDGNVQHRSAAATTNLIRWIDGAGTYIDYKQFDNFKSDVPGYEVHGMQFLNVQESFFVNSAQNDFRLRVGSPAYKSGVDLPADILLKVGRVPGRKLSIGALKSIIE